MRAQWGAETNVAAINRTGDGHMKNAPPLVDGGAEVVQQINQQRSFCTDFASSSTIKLRSSQRCAGEERDDDPAASQPDVELPTTIQLAQTAVSEGPIFTNCGKNKIAEVRAKWAKYKIKRVPFTVSRLMEFCTRRELVNQTGHDVHEWPLVVVKELIDNALDACEEAEIAPVISIEIEGDKITITDNGPGIPARVIDSVLDYRPRFEPGSILLADARRAGQRAQDHSADGQRTQRAPRRKRLRYHHH
jgi:hypothetical protein